MRKPSRAVHVRVRRRAVLEQVEHVQLGVTRERLHNALRALRGIERLHGDVLLCLRDARAARTRHDPRASACPMSSMNMNSTMNGALNSTKADGSKQKMGSDKLTVSN